jgi:aminoglycoside 2'-N-acetyltransferase I
VGFNSEREDDRIRLRRLATGDLTATEVAAIRALLWAAFEADESYESEEPFSEDDWEHSIGGTHFVLDVDGEIVAHASVVQREIHIDGRPLRTGYVEAVATAPDRQGRGLGSIVMGDASGYIREHFELGALGTGRHNFYERLGWLRWKGPTAVRTPGGTHPTPDEDGDILVLPTPSSPRLDLAASISCEWRPGDVW